MIHDDVPSPIDLRSMPDAREWAATALSKRPWRVEFFDRFADELAACVKDAPRVLELGSGPGFLAGHLLQRLPQLRYVALDFSAAMHKLARERLGAKAAAVEFVERSFRDEAWPQGLGRFDAVVTNQAVHELRHKRHAPALHAQALSVLSSGGVYLVCDHFVGEGGMVNDQLYMTVDEQRRALLDAGFTRVESLLCRGGLLLQRASAS